MKGKENRGFDASRSSCRGCQGNEDPTILVLAAVPSSLDSLIEATTRSRSPVSISPSHLPHLHIDDIQNSEVARILELLSDLFRTDIITRAHVEAQRRHFPARERARNTKRSRKKHRPRDRNGDSVEDTFESAGERYPPRPQKTCARGCQAQYDRR